MHLGRDDHEKPSIQLQLYSGPVLENFTSSGKTLSR